jgi:hypothetical protein
VKKVNSNILRLTQQSKFLIQTYETMIYEKNEVKMQHVIVNCGILQ